MSNPKDACKAVRELEGVTAAWIERYLTGGKTVSVLVIEVDPALFDTKPKPLFALEDFVYNTVLTNKEWGVGDARIVPNPK